MKGVHEVPRPAPPFSQLRPVALDQSTTEILNDPRSDSEPLVHRHLRRGKTAGGRSRDGGTGAAWYVRGRRPSRCPVWAVVTRVVGGIRLEVCLERAAGEYRQRDAFPLGTDLRVV